MRAHRSCVRVEFAAREGSERGGARRDSGGARVEARRESGGAARERTRLGAAHATYTHSLIERPSKPKQPQPHTRVASARRIARKRVVSRHDTGHRTQLESLTHQADTLLTPRIKTYKSVLKRTTHRGFCGSGCLLLWPSHITTVNVAPREYESAILLTHEILTHNSPALHAWTAASTASSPRFSLVRERETAMLRSRDISNMA